MEKEKNIWLGVLSFIILLIASYFVIFSYKSFGLVAIISAILAFYLRNRLLYWLVFICSFVLIFYGIIGLLMGLG